jgi:hypothetical protein
VYTVKEKEVVWCAHVMGPRVKMFINGAVCTSAGERIHVTGYIPWDKYHCFIGTWCFSVEHISWVQSLL